MAVVFYESPEDNYDKPWVEDYYNSLEVSKQKTFFKQVFLVEKVSVTQKGLIIETLEFKSWMWKSETSTLELAIKVCQDDGHAVCLGFRKGTNGKFKTLVGSDAALVQQVQGDSKKGYVFTKDFS